MVECRCNRLFYEDLCSLLCLAVKTSCFEYRVLGSQLAGDFDMFCHKKISTSGSVQVEGMNTYWYKYIFSTSDKTMGDTIMVMHLV